MRRQNASSAMSTERPGRNAAGRDHRRPRRKHCVRHRILNGQIVASYLKDATTRVRIFSIDGRLLYATLSFPGVGTAYRFSPVTRTTRRRFLRFQASIRRPASFRYDLRTGKSELWRRAEVDFDPDSVQGTASVFQQRGWNSCAHVSWRIKQGNRAGRQQSRHCCMATVDSTFPSHRAFPCKYVAWMEMGGVVRCDKPAWREVSTVSRGTSLARR